MVYKGVPTVYPHPGFDPREDGDTLRSAMKGMGTDEDTIIDILTNRTNAQRQLIAKYFKDELDRDLIEDLKGEMGGNFEEVIVGLMLPPEKYICRELHRAMDGLGTEENALIEIICSKNNEEMCKIVETYESMYDRPLAEQLCGETSGELRRLLTFIVTGVRDNGGRVDEAKAKEQAAELFEAGEGRFGTEESVFTKIIAKENFNQLAQVFEEYKEVSGDTIEQALNHELDGTLLEAMLAVVECIQSPATFFAKRVYEAMHGAGTDEPTLIRVIVSRAEIDLATIKEEFERLYDKTLESYVGGETRGDFKKALLGLIK